MMHESVEGGGMVVVFFCVCVHKKHNLKCSDSLTCDDVTNDDQQSFEL